MTDDLDPRALDAERHQLLGLAYRMLGTVADAEDAVQETYARWYRMPEAERAAIRSPGAWLTRVASRVCLDMLGSARARRERYVGEWLPEPVPGETPFGGAAAASDPLDRVTLDDSVSTALLVVLESLTPAQRVAFVLHDVFGMPFAEIAASVGRSVEATRQLASQARTQVRERRAGAASRATHDALAQAFAAACATGDVTALVAVLDPDVVLRADGGGHVSAARRPVVGADRVARFMLGIPRLAPAAQVTPTLTPDGLGFAVTLDGAPHSVITLGVRGERITDVWIMRNPEKLSRWG
ncbi:RNA polymerase sigma factor SigJ [Microbacterium sp. SLBN-146]|uniref:RNA polymerase sigma factor SigJ n=1 Tax=Microbacterium sp. SLBN-146 TaxID=2768457 RepID=UPI00114F9317|nr:RNA polymerase sigma factor SigJ [Microbacterium sp. SLBN-146]